MRMGEGQTITGSGWGIGRTPRRMHRKTAIYGKKYYVDLEEHCDRLSSIDINIMYVK